MSKEERFFNPAGHRVLIKLDKEEEVSKGGIILASTHVERHQLAKQTGELVAVGQSAWKAFDDGAAWAKVGDVVVVPKYAGNDFTYKGDRYKLCNDEDVFGVEVKDKGV
jgi:chaperonin GroES